MTFDRLIFIDRLREAGVSDEIARAHAEALREALFETVATKSDLAEAVDAARTESDRIRTDLKEAVQTLDRKIEITARDLTIKGAAGLMVIASIIIGLKLFG